METRHLPENFARIPGWGSDLGRRGGTHGVEPLPMGDALGMPTLPEQQIAWVEVLTSTEHAGLTPIFGTPLPPAGVSGSIRRLAFRFSENDLRHWLLLLFADRVDVGEGLVFDLAHGHIPNLVQEMGVRAEWEHNRAALLRKLALAGLVIGSVAVLRAQKRRSRR